ncbi:MAG: zf-HC2 domain-containing protein [Gemmataceae bacterium]|nr:zf-HC2 domain-containing protein [Gemmataceae bacterium]MCI0742459.1 zf-HC2 domain-containing protein [Gemmataceae bacterium]
MNCNDARQHWNLYHDSEGDAELHFQISEHVAMCPDCAAWFKQQSRLEDLIKEKLGPQPATSVLWDNILRKTGLVRPARVRSWIWFAGVAASVAVVGALLWLWQGSSANAADLSKLAASWHEKVLAGKEPEFRPHSQNPDLDVEKYLRGRVAFPVRCPPRRDAGFVVNGAGICQLGGESTAYLTGHVDDAPVSIFVLARDSLAAFPHQQQALRTEKTHQCREGPYQMVLAVVDRNAVLVIGQTEADRLDRVVRAYGSYSDHN